MFWYRISVWYYMDPEPFYEYKLFSCMPDAEAWAEAENRNWSGGTVSISGPAFPKEIDEFIKKNNVQLDEDTRSKIYDLKYYLSNGD